MDAEKFKGVREGYAAADRAGLIDGANSRIGNGMAACLLLVALIADAFTLIPVVGDFIGPIFWVCMSVFLWAKGFGFLRLGRIVTEAISTVAEMIPVIQELPTIVVGMIIIIVLIRIEDKTGKSLLKPMSKGKMPLNVNGMRRPQNPRDSQPDASRNPNIRPPKRAEASKPVNDEELPFAA